MPIFGRTYVELDLGLRALGRAGGRAGGRGGGRAGGRAGVFEIVIVIYNNFIDLKTALLYLKSNYNQYPVGSLSKFLKVRVVGLVIITDISKQGAL